MSQRRLSLRALLRQKGEIEKDLYAFRSAYDIVRRRLAQAAELPDMPSLDAWSGTKAVTGSLELSVHYLEKELADYNQAAELIREGQIENADDDTPKPPVLKLVPKES